MNFDKFPPEYRHKEIKQVLQWVQADESGIVCSLPGTGRAMFLRYLTEHPDITEKYLKDDPKRYYFVPVDLYDLPDHRLATFYRVILRSFYEARSHFGSFIWAERISQTYHKVEAQRDVFVVQSALRHLLIEFKNEGVRVVLVFNRFDRFLRQATPQMVYTFRGLRDGYRRTLSYIFGLDRPLNYLQKEPAIKPLLPLMDTHVCWIAPHDELNARHMIRRNYRFGESYPLDNDTEGVMVNLTGGHPMLIRVICNEWEKIQQNMSGDLIENPQQVVQLSSMTNRLNELWDSFSAAEKDLLADISRGRKKELAKHRDLVQMLLTKGVCEQRESGIAIKGTLVQSYIQAQERKHLGEIYYNQNKRTLFQGKRSLSMLTPLGKQLLQFFVENPYTEHPKSRLFYELWPQDYDKSEAGLMGMRLQQIVSALRKEIEPNDQDPIYIITWRGRPEGGYKFIPEGQPQSRN